MFNPLEPRDCESLFAAIAEASEICTALPSVEFFAKGNPSVADVLVQGFKRKLATSGLPDCAVYTAENHNHAAEILESAILAKLGTAEKARMGKRVQFSTRLSAR